ncbi:hypothetical protein HanXRQr2_Chr16g0740161 [Helianthus annuus]|uniref:Uncharacterized protein n=1 Tax=Helianthus annuus TaxID=4232 RepID=A0A9K3DRC8_HELAN|nr:hypothetical protein HanXRQr2_Chr16g0740161 [Helianthus annuus]
MLKHTLFKASSLCRRIEAPAECAILTPASSSSDDCFLPALVLTPYLSTCKGSIFSISAQPHHSI